MLTLHTAILDQSMILWTEDSEPTSTRSDDAENYHTNAAQGDRLTQATGLPSQPVQLRTLHRRHPQGYLHDRVQKGHRTPRKHVSPIRRKTAIRSVSKIAIEGTNTSCDARFSP